MLRIRDLLMHEAAFLDRHKAPTPLLSGSSSCRKAHHQGDMQGDGKTLRPKKAARAESTTSVTADGDRTAAAARASLEVLHSQPGLPENAVRGGLPTLGVLAIFRDEAQVLHEWLTHYTLEGVTQFVLLDQESADNGAAIVRAWAASRPAIRLSLHRAVGNYQQVRHYNRVSGLLATDWVLIVDLDEWVYARLGFATIRHVLGSPQHVPPNAALIGMPWLHFGANATIAQPPSVVDAFVRRAPLRHFGTVMRRRDPILSLAAPSCNGSLLRHCSDIAQTLLSFSLSLSLPACLPASACLTTHVARMHTHRHSPSEMKSLVRRSELCMPIAARQARPHNTLPWLHHYSWTSVRRGCNDTRCCVEHQHRASASARLYLPDGRPAGRLDRLKFVGPLNVSSADQWPLHLNHYRLYSCEYFARVKMSRGSVIRAANDKMRTWYVLYSLAQPGCPPLSMTRQYPRYHQSPRRKRALPSSIRFPPCPVCLRKELLWQPRSWRQRRPRRRAAPQTPWRAHARAAEHEPWRTVVPIANLADDGADTWANSAPGPNAAHRGARRLVHQGGRLAAHAQVENPGQGLVIRVERVLSAHIIVIRIFTRSAKLQFT